MAYTRKCLLEDFVDEYPNLWDPRDLHYRDKKVKEQCLREILEKCNRVSSIPLTMEDLKRMVKLYYNRRNRASRGNAGTTQGTSENEAASMKHQLEELVAEYPCLWDTEDLNYPNPVMTSHCQEQLLIKYNSLSNIAITMEQLKKELELLRGRLSEQRLGVAGRPSDSRGGSLSDLGSSNSADPVYQTQCVVQENPNQQTPLFNILFHCCGVCGDVRSDCLTVTDKPYIENNKTTFGTNGLSIELDFDKIKMVCENCDTKLKEIYAFVKQIKCAQDKMYRVNVSDEMDDEMTIDDDEDNYQKLIMDAPTVTDTGLVNPKVLHKKKCEEVLEKKKKCRVTIGLNSCYNDRNTMDDIGIKYQMFKKSVSVENSKAVDKASNVTGSQDSEVISLIVKEEIETDEVLKKNDETGEKLTVDDIVANYHMFGNSDVISNANSNESADDSRMVINEDSDAITFDVKNEIGTDDVHTEVDETGEIVTENHIRDKQACDRVKTNETASAVSEVASRGDSVCGMPKSDLIQLVESIVSRMLNK